jgi:TPR repeat protein
MTGDATAKYKYANYLLDKKRNTEQVTEIANNAEEVLKEVKVIQTKAKKNRKLRKLHTLNADNVDEKDDAEHWLRLSAESGHLDAMVTLGNELIKQETAEAAMEGITLYEKACDLNHLDACFNLGNIYHQGLPVAGIDKDLNRSLSFFRKAADAGDPSSAYWLGHCYASAEGGIESVDMQIAERYFKYAADADHPAANYYLALMHRNQMLENSSNNNQAIAKIDYQKCKDKSSFEYYLQRAFDTGDADAAFCLAEVYLNGSDGFEVDVKRGIDFLIEAIDRGSADAPNTLGAMFYSGSYGLSVDKRRAFELYNLAAERGCQQAWRNLAAMYAIGDGVAKSEESAKHIMKVIFGEDI